ncbi:MAG: aldo/keto reductase [Deltaproteobacteria bacterium]|nr:aldo/keto reductase [Deltaproteobacteria bacterium]
MHYKLFGRDKIKVSEIGLGCWQIGGTWGEVSSNEANAILDAALDNNVTFLDTSDVYGGGRSEQLIGDLLQRRRDQVFVATKIGRAFDLFPDNYSEAGIRSSVEASLKRLQTDVLDLVQLHCIPLSVIAQQDVFGWLRTLQKEGKIKRFGASIESMEEALKYIEIAPDIYSLQIIFNIFRQKAIHELFDIAEEKEIGIIARVPLASGLLTGKLSNSSTFSKGDHRNFNRDGKAFHVGETFAGLPFEKGLELTDKLKKLVPSSMTLAQMALRWIVDFKAVSVVIPGASRAEQILSNTSISDMEPLSKELHDSLKSFYTENKVAEHIRGLY